MISMVLFTLPLLVSCQLSDAACPPMSTAVYQAFSDLYYGTNGDHWVYANGATHWNMSQLPARHPCDIPVWYGLVCDGACNVNNLQLMSNNMSGRLSESLGNFANMFVLQISSNPHLSGTLPRSLSYMKNLAAITFGSNALTGSLPDTWGNFTYVSFIVLQNNRLVGSIPSTWSSRLSSLTRIALNNNRLTGTIPSTLFSIPRLNNLDIRDNRFQSPFPTAITKLKATFRDLRVSNNLFAEPFPTYLTQMTTLQYLWISNNFFSSTLPDTFSSMLYLKDVAWDNNLLTGSLPTSFTNLNKLTTINLFNNFLSHSIAATFGLTTKLTSINFFNNYFTGKIPKPLFQNNTFVSFDIHANFFTGTIPNGHQVGNIYFFVNNNLFSGSLPILYPLAVSWEIRFDSNLLSGSILEDQITQLQSVRVLNLSLNYFTGTLPRTLSNVKSLTIFDVRSNNLHGTIGTVFHPLPALNALNLQNNYFVGNLDDMFNLTSQLSLQIIDVSDNGFTGSIPEDIFRLPGGVQMVSLTKNCFQMSSFPTTMCAAKDLVLLSLDGLHTEPVCQERIFPRLPSVRTFQLQHPLRQHIPACLFTTLTNLSILHISGNNLQGGLPEVEEISASLADLTLSHNQLTGTIPDVFQRHPWQFLDLSFNKFTGILSSDISTSFVLQPGTSLRMQNNRLSGTIPAALQLVEDISLLQGNIFQCDAHKTSLPIHDPLYSSYNCGSEVVDNSFYTWLGWVGLVLVAYFLLLCLVKSKQAKPRQQWNTFEHIAQRMLTWVERDFSSYWQIYNSKASFAFFAQDIYQFYEFGAILREIRIWCMKVTLLISCVFFPFYPLLSVWYSTYAHTYAWTFSMAFLSGTTPSVLVLAALMAFLLVLFSEWCASYSVNLYYLSKRMAKKEETIHKIVEMMQAAPSVAAMDRREEADRVPAATASGADRGEKADFINPMLVKKYKDELKAERRISQRKAHPVGSASPGDNTAAAAASPLHPSTSSAEQQQQQQLKMPSQRSRQYYHEEDEDDDFDPLSLEAWKQSQKQLQQDIQLSWKWYLVMICGLVVNVVVVLAVNMSFVALTSNPDISSAAKQLISFLVSIFKIVWNSTVMDAFQSVLVSTLPGHQDRGESIITAYMLWISLFNNIIVPCIAVAVISSDCFYYAFVQDAAVVTTITLPQCDGYFFSATDGLQCVSVVDVNYTTAYDPPYTYSYQCSSSILTSFVDIFIYRFLITTFVNPLMVFPLKYLQHEMYHRYGGETSYLYLAIKSAIPPLLLPLAVEDTKHAVSSTATGIELQDIIAGTPGKGEADDVAAALPSADTPAAVQRQEEETSSPSASAKKDKDELIVKFKAKNTIINLISDIAILLTFGVIFPPIALIGCCSIVSNTIFIQVALGRLVVLSRSQPDLIKSIVRINAKCGGVRWLFMNSLKSLSLLLALFWSCFLVDIYGDAKGWQGSVWIFAVMGCVPVMMYLSNRIKRYCFPPNWHVYWTQSLVLRPETLSAALPQPPQDNAEKTAGSVENQREEEDSKEQEFRNMRNLRAASVRFSLIYPSAT